MFSTKIAKILNRNSFTYPYFIGCFPADKIPRLKRGPFPHCMVVNTDSSGLEGTHWTAIFVESLQSVEYYDSFGEWPPPFNIHKFLNHFTKIVYNSLSLQSERSASCGMHVIYYLYKRCRGMSLPQLLNHYKSCVTTPDVISRAFVRSILFNKV
jgi:serine/threonine protein kinase